MKLLIIFLTIGLASAIKLNQYLDSSCTNLFQTYYFGVNDCFSAGNGANAMNFTICNGTYFSSIIYSGTTCTGNPVMTISGDPIQCGLERRLVYCNENAQPNPAVIKSDSNYLSLNLLVYVIGVIGSYFFYKVKIDFFY